MRGYAGKPPILERELLFSAITSSEIGALAAYKTWRPTVDFAGPIDEETTALLPLLHEALLKLGQADPLLGVFAGVARRAWYENHTLLASVQQALDWVQIGRDVGGAGWVIGTDLSSTISNVLNGTLFTSVLQASQVPRAVRADPYGHGTHVASTAAGSGSVLLSSPSIPERNWSISNGKRRQ